MEYDIKDLSLKNIGREKIEWVKDFMPVLSSIEKKYIDKQPLKGIRVSMALHLEAKTAYLAIVMKNLGAEVRVSEVILFPRRIKYVQHLWIWEYRYLLTEEWTTKHTTDILYRLFPINLI